MGKSSNKQKLILNLFRKHSSFDPPKTCYLKILSQKWETAHLFHIDWVVLLKKWLWGAWTQHPEPICGLYTGPLQRPWCPDGTLEQRQRLWTNKTKDWKQGKGQCWLLPRWSTVGSVTSVGSAIKTRLQAQPWKLRWFEQGRWPLRKWHEYNIPIRGSSSAQLLLNPIRPKFSAWEELLLLQRVDNSSRVGASTLRWAWRLNNSRESKAKEREGGMELTHGRRTAAVVGSGRGQLHGQKCESCRVKKELSPSSILECAPLSEVLA